jgi:hypothetical protein
MRGIWTSARILFIEQHMQPASIPEDYVLHIFKSHALLNKQRCAAEQPAVAAGAGLIEQLRGVL